MHLYTGSNLPDIESDSHEENDPSEPSEDSYIRQSSQESRDSGRQARLSSQRQHGQVNIDAFFNTHLAFPSNKKDLSVLGKQERRPRQETSPWRNAAPSSGEEESIMLVSLPEVERAERLRAAVGCGEEELGRLQRGWEGRFR
jgi:hypothetical protein